MCFNYPYFKLYFVEKATKFFTSQPIICFSRNVFNIQSFIFLFVQKKAKTSSIILFSFVKVLNQKRILAQKIYLYFCLRSQFKIGETILCKIFCPWAALYIQINHFFRFYYFPVQPILQYKCFLFILWKSIYDCGIGRCW